MQIIVIIFRLFGYTVQDEITVEMREPILSYLLSELETNLALMIWV